MRRAAKVDGNHRAVVAAFRALGCSVQSLAAVGKGVPDLLVGFANLNHLVEVKVAKGKETPAQVKWAALWRTTVHLVRSVEDAQALVKAWRVAEDTRAMAAARWLSPPVAPTQKWPLATMKPSLAVEQGFDADDYNGRPRYTEGQLTAIDKETAALTRHFKPGEWLPLPHKDSPTVKP